jgi:hypothetical protein
MQSISNPNMTLKLLILISSISLLIACNSEPKEPETVNVTPSMLSSTNCYSYTNNRDTVLLKTTTVSDTVRGTLSYNYYQKDKNNGKIEGIIKDSLLIADYLFMSEGVQSIRQVAFKMTGDSLIEGYGEIETKDGKSVFKNTTALDFNQAVILKKVDCEK